MGIVRRTSVFTDGMCDFDMRIRNSASFADGPFALCPSIRNSALFTDGSPDYEGKSSLRMLMSSFRSRLICWFDALYLK